MLVLPDSPFGRAHLAYALCIAGGCCSLDNFVANKIGKVLIDIGKHTWPQEYPAMLEEIRSLCMSPTTFSTGLMLLGTVAVEFVSPLGQTSWGSRIGVDGTMGCSLSD